MKNRPAAHGAPSDETWLGRRLRSRAAGVARGAILALPGRMSDTATASELALGSNRPSTAIVLLAAASGARSMTGVAVAARELVAPNVAAVVALMAGAELVADKLPGIPNRTDPLPLLGRIGAGAVIGAAVSAVSGRNRVAGAMIGALSSWVAAEASFRFRRELSRRASPLAAALIEDAVVCAIAAAGARCLATPEAPEAA
jgi:uncharacterized membrane protein